jgi:hypothetical protein
MIAAHARPKPTNASVWTFIIAVLSAPEQRDRIERLLAAFMGDQNQLFQLERVPNIPSGVIVSRCMVGIHPRSA